jgi:hypothetical protein
VAVPLAVALAVRVPVALVVTEFVLVFVFVTVLVLVSVFVFVTVAVLVWVPVPWVAQASGGELDRMSSGRSPLSMLPLEVLHAIPGCPAAEQKSAGASTVEAQFLRGTVLPAGVVMFPPSVCWQNPIPVPSSTSTESPAFDPSIGYVTDAAHTGEATSEANQSPSKSARFISLLINAA